jgi:regulatory protein
MAKRARAPVQSENELYEYALRSLGRRMRTVAELKRLMRTRLPEENGAAWIESVVARLKERRYLNDTQYAKTYTRLRQENQSLGRRRVQQELIGKGVHADVIAATLDDSYKDVNEEELARQLLARKRVQKPLEEKQTARVMRMLMRSGFSSTVIFRILKKWHVEIDPADMERLDDSPE